MGQWDLLFGYLITSWWLRGRQEHQRGQLGLQGWIFHDFSGFEEPVGSRFLAVWLFFLGLRLSILRGSYEVCFLMGLGEKMIPGSVVGCAENILNTMVFVRFHFFTYSVNWMISNRLLGVFLIAFWNPGLTFSDF